MLDDSSGPTKSLLDAEGGGYSESILEAIMEGPVDLPDSLVPPSSSVSDRALAVVKPLLNGNGKYFLGAGSLFVVILVVAVAVTSSSGNNSSSHSHKVNSEDIGGLWDDPNHFKVSHPSSHPASAARVAAAA